MLFHTGHSGIGTGMRAGRHSSQVHDPMPIDDVAVTFPSLIIMAHPAFLAGRSHLDLSAQTDGLHHPPAGHPVFLPDAHSDANTMLKSQGARSDYPWILDRWLRISRRSRFATK